MPENIEIKIYICVRERDKDYNRIHFAHAAETNS